MRALIGLHIHGSAPIADDVALRRGAPGGPAVDRGRAPERWVVVDIEEAYIHCRKHIPHLVPAAREERRWGTDNPIAKGGDYFGAKAQQLTRS